MKQTSKAFGDVDLIYSYWVPSGLAALGKRLANISALLAIDLLRETRESQALVPRSPMALPKLKLGQRSPSY